MFEGSDLLIKQKGYLFSSIFIFWGERGSAYNTRFWEGVTSKAYKSVQGGGGGGSKLPNFERTYFLNGPAAKFLYEIICRHGSMRIQINDQGKEFVNEVSENLHDMTVTEKRITSAYHPQSNGLCKRQNRTIKDSLVKVLEEKPKEWPNIIDGILFAHRVCIHCSTKYSPFFLMYNRHPILPIDIKCDLIDNNADKEPESNPYDITTFQAVLESAAFIREATNEKASHNIKKAQVKHQRDYNNRHSTISTTLPIGSKVLLQNQRRQDTKGRKFSYKWIGPYTIKSISKTELCVLISEKGYVLKKKYNVSLLKPYNSKADSDPPEEINEKDQESDKDKQQQTAGKNLFDKLPDEIHEMILLNVTKSHAVDAFCLISRTCKRFQSVIEGKKDEILPMVHINFPENVFQNLPRRANKIKVSVKKLSKFSGSCSGVIECVSKAIGKKLWRSAWLLIAKRKHNWFIIERAFWKQRQNT